MPSGRSHPFPDIKKILCFPGFPHVNVTREWKSQEVPGLFVWFFSPHVSVSMYFMPEKISISALLHCPTSRSRKAEEKYQKEKDRCCNTGDFSLFKLNGSIPAMEQISPNPFPRVDLGTVFSWGHVSAQAIKIRRLDENRHGKNIFGKLGSSPYTHKSHNALLGVSPFFHHIIAIS